MKRTLIVMLMAASCAFAQEKGNVIYHSASVGGMAFGGFDRAPIQGAPYSATINNESIQTLADGNRIVQTSTGTTARDSQGRTRHDTALPAIGNLSATNAPRLIFVQDPIAQTSYTLNLTDKTAQKMPVFSAMAGAATGSVHPKACAGHGWPRRPSRVWTSSEYVRPKAHGRAGPGQHRGPRFSDHGRCAGERRAHDPYNPWSENRSEEHTSE